MATRTVSVKLVADIGQYVSGMSAASKSTAGLGDDVDRSTAKTKTGFELAGKGALLMGGAVVAGLGLAVSKSMEFESSMSAVQAATGATAGTMTQLRDAAIEAGSSTAYSATEAADAITEMSKAGVSAKDIMGGGLTGALSLAAAGQIEVADAAGIASTAMVQFNLAGEDLPHVADLLAAGAGKAMGSVGDLGAALNQAGLIASAAGLSIEETTGGLAAFASAGLVGSDAGTSFKTMLQALQAPSGKSAELMDELGLKMYDANGNMLSLSDMAGQLQTRLGGLTEEQRNAALAQIFGSDAVRAANVLYKEGADGIAEWTSKVNDSGYAAEQAAALQDNLKGDLEKLGGAFDTLMISLGSGAQGPLREIVQGFTGLLDAAGFLIGVVDDIPGPVIAAVAAFAGFGLLRGPVAALFGQIAVGITSTITGLGMATGATGALSLAMGAARLAVVGLVTAALPLAVLVAAAYAVKNVIDFTNAGDDARQTVDELRESLKGMDNAGRMQVAAEGIDTIKQKLSEAKAITDAYNDQGWFDKVLWTNPFGDETTDVADAKESTREYEEALRDLEGQQQLTKEATAGLAGQYHLTGDEVVALADKHGIDLSAGLTAASGAFQSLMTAEGAASAASEGASLSADVLASQLQAVSDAASEGTQQIDLLKTSLDVLTGGTVTLYQAEAQLGAALAQATGALEGLDGATLNADGSLNAYSESGRAAGDVLLGVRDSGNQLIATLIQQGATTGEVADADARLRQSFIDTAAQMGIVGPAAETLADQILGIPEERRTEIVADTAAATAAVATVATAIANLPSVKTVRILTDTSGATVGVDFSNGLRARASGGPVWPKETFLVGEQGPELVQFGASGYVTPAAVTASVLAAAPTIQPRDASPMMRGREMSMTANYFNSVPPAAAPSPGGSPQSVTFNTTVTGVPNVPTEDQISSVLRRSQLLAGGRR